VSAIFPLELDEDWYHSDDPINAGISFYVKVSFSGGVALLCRRERKGERGRGEERGGDRGGARR